VSIFLSCLSICLLACNRSSCSSSESLTFWESAKIIQATRELLLERVCVCVCGTYHLSSHAIYARGLLEQLSTSPLSIVTPKRFSYSWYLRHLYPTDVVIVRIDLAKPSHRCFHVLKDGIFLAGPAQQREERLIEATQHSSLLKEWGGVGFPSFINTQALPPHPSKGDLPDSSPKSSYNANSFLRTQKKNQTTNGSECMSFCVLGWHHGVHSALALMASST
jgi:hypothetical protein